MIAQFSSTFVFSPFELHTSLVLVSIKYYKNKKNILYTLKEIAVDLLRLSKPDVLCLEVWCPSCHREQCASEISGCLVPSYSHFLLHMLTVIAALGAELGTMGQKCLSGAEELFWNAYFVPDSSQVWNTDHIWFLDQIHTHTFRFKGRVGLYRKAMWGREVLLSCLGISIWIYWGIGTLVLHRLPEKTIALDHPYITALILKVLCVISELLVVSSTIDWEYIFTNSIS